MDRMRFSVIVLPALLAVAVAGCTAPPNPQPVAIDEPVDALNAVEPPHTSADSRFGGSLSTDVERLQDARRLYELTREQRRDDVERSQQRCLQHDDSRRVPITGAGAGAVFCEPAVE